MLVAPTLRGLLHNARPILDYVVPLIPVPLGGRFGHGKSVDVWAEHADVIMRKKWTMSQEYDYPSSHINGKGIYLHCYCAELYTGNPVAVGMVVDHLISGSLLNCAPNNLAIVTRGENNLNTPKKLGATSRHRGVSKKWKRWALKIGHKGYDYTFGTFEVEDDAGAAYNIIMTLLHQRFIPNDVSSVSSRRWNELQAMMIGLMGGFGWKPNGGGELRPPVHRQQKPRKKKSCPPLPKLSADGLIHIPMSGLRAGDRSVAIEPCSWPEVGGKSVSLNGSYPAIMSEGKYRAVHIVVWEAFHKKKVTKGFTINHRDQNHFNAAIRNLEESTHSDQMTNRTFFRPNGLPQGVWEHTGGYECSIKIFNRRFYFGYYRTAAEGAHAIRMAHEFCRPGFKHWLEALPEIDPSLLTEVTANVLRLYKKEEANIFVSLAMIYIGTGLDENACDAQSVASECESDEDASEHEESGDFEESDECDDDDE